MKSAVSEDVAIKDIEKWLDFRRIGNRRREKLSKDIDTLVDAVCDGHLKVVTDNKVVQLNQILIFPHEVGEAKTYAELLFKARFHSFEITEATQGFKDSDSSGKGNAIIAAMTGVPRAVIEKLELSDLSISSTIVGLYS